MKEEKPIIKKIKERYANAPKVNCEECDFSEKTCIFRGFIDSSDNCTYFKNKRRNK